MQAFCKLLDGVLKKHGTDDIMFQRNVEALVWDLVKEDLIKAEVFQKHPNITFSNIFQIFCLYNRFCDPISSGAGDPGGPGGPGPPLELGMYGVKILNFHKLSLILLIGPPLIKIVPSPLRIGVKYIFPE